MSRMIFKSMKYWVPIILKLATCFLFIGCNDTNVVDQPNIILVMTDDMGYGDISSNGHPTIYTPHLDKIAAEGQKWTNFYAAASVCTPSRASLMTGRYPVRSGMASSKRRVLFPDSEGGLPSSEITIAELLKKQDYVTACIGKWHLGHKKKFLPISHGFDYYWGIPYSNDMDFIAEQDYMEANKNPKNEYFNVPIMENDVVVERPALQQTLTRRYTEKSLEFIRNNKNAPFFLYLAHSMPHVPLFRSEDFAGRSDRGIYGDVIEEIDWSVGQIISELEKLGIDEKTLVVFTSDNGPWLIFEEHGGSAGILRSGKGTTFEGGMRVPALFYWKNTIETGLVQGIGTMLDLLPTLANLAGASIPNDCLIDGIDLSPTLLNNEDSPRDLFFYYWGDEVVAVRNEDYKMHLKVNTPWQYEQFEVDTLPLLNHLGHDPSEKYNLFPDKPDVIEELKKEIRKHEAGTDNQNQIINQLEL